MSHLTGIFTKKVLTQYRPSETFRLGMPQLKKIDKCQFSKKKATSLIQSYTGKRILAKPKKKKPASFL